MPRHVIIKLLKAKDKYTSIYSSQRETVHYRGIPVQVTADFPSETMEARGKWHNIFQVLKEQNCRPQILFPEKISFKNEGEIRHSQTKKN